METFLNAYGQELYNKVKSDLEAAGLWHEVYCMQLEMYCFAGQMVRKLAKEIHEEGTTYKHTNRAGHETTTINPKLLTYQIFVNEAFKMGDKFGQSPLARKKLGIKNKEEKTGVNRFKLGRIVDFKLGNE